MKLHLPTRLRAAVLACFAVVTSFTTTLTTGAIAGGTFAVTMAALVAPQAEAASYLVSKGGDEYFHNATFTNDDDGGSRQWGHFSVDKNGKSNAGREDILHFGQSSTESVKFLIQFDHFAFGGLQVDAGTLVTGIGSSGSRTFYFGKDGGTFDSVISSNFTLEATSATYFHGTHNWTISKNVTFTLGSAGGFGTGKSVFGDSYSALITQSGQGTVNFSGRSYVGNYRLQSGNLINATISQGTFTFLGNGTVATVGDVHFYGGVDISALSFGRLQANVDANSIVRIQKNKAVTFGSDVKIELGLDKIQEGGVNSLSDGTEYRIFSNEGSISGWKELSTENFTAGGEKLPCNLGVQTTERGLILVRRISPIIAADTDGVQRFEWNDADFIWKKNRNNAYETAVATGKSSSVLLDASAEITVEEDGVVIRELVVCGGETDAAVPDNHPGKTDVSLLGGFLKATNGIVVQEGGTLELKSDGGRHGFIRSDYLTIKDGSVVKFAASNVTGYDVADESLRLINIESGGTLMLSNYGTGTSNRYERFAGTINLYGSILDDTEQPGLSRLDMYGGSATLVASYGHVTAGIQLAQNSTTFTVYGRLVLDGMLSGAKNVDANLNFVKSGGDGTNEVHWDVNGEVKDVGTILVRNNMSTATFTGGGNFAQLDLKANNIYAVFSGEEQYDIGYVTMSGTRHVMNDNNRGRLFRVDAGTVVNIGTNASGVSYDSSWGSNVLVNGEVNTQGEFLLADSSEDQIRGAGVINAASFKAKNNGTYRFFINEFNVEGQTRLEKGISIEAGTFNMKGAISSNANGSVTVKDSGNLYIRSVNESGTVNIQSLFLEEKGGEVYVESGEEDVVASVTIANTKQLKVINNDNGLVTLTGTVNIVDEPDNGKANATRTESTVFYERVLNPVESAEESDNGYRADQRHYRVVSNGENLTFGANAVGQINGNGANVRLAVLTIGEGEEAKDYHVHQRYSFDPTTYWVNTGDVEYTSYMDVYTPATHIRLSGGLMEGKAPAKLTLNTNLKEGVYLGISVGSETTLHLADGVELDYDQLDFDVGLGTIHLTGSGRYTQPGGSVDFKVTTESLQDAENWHGTIVLGGEVDELDINRIGNVNSTVELCGNYGSIKPGSEVNVHVHLVDWTDDYGTETYPALNINSGVDGDITTFHNKVTGEGNVQFSGGHDHTVVFAGEISDWTGTFYATSTTGSATVKFTGDDEINASFNHNSDAACALNVILDNAAAEKVVMNGGVNASSLAVAAGTTADILGEVSLTGKLTVDGVTTLHTVTGIINEAEINSKLTLTGYTDFGTVNIGTGGSLVMDLSSVEDLESLYKWHYVDEKSPLVKIDALHSSVDGAAVSIGAIASDKLLLTLRDAQEVVLAEITNLGAGMTLSLDVYDINGNPIGCNNSVVVMDSSHYRYTYTLETNDETGITRVILDAQRTALGWIGSEDDEWTAADTVDEIKWAGAAYEDGPQLNPYGGAIGYFSGNGSATVNVAEDGAHANMLIVSSIPGTKYGVEEYTLQGGAVEVNGGTDGFEAGYLVVNSGGLVLNNEKVSVQGDALIADLEEHGEDFKGKLTVNTQLEVTGEMDVIRGASFVNNGTTQVDGRLYVGKEASVTNTGLLEVGSVSASGATVQNTGTLSVGEDGGVIGTLAGTGTLKNSGELTIQTDTSLESLENRGTLNLGDKKLTVGTEITAGGTVIAGAAALDNAAFENLTVSGDVESGHLTVNHAASIGGNLNASSLTVKNTGTVVMVSGDATLTDTEDAALTNYSTLQVGGKLTVGSDISYGGVVSAGSAELQNANFSELTVTGAVNAGVLNVAAGSMGSLVADTLISTDGGKVKVTGDATVDTFSVNGELAVGGKLKAWEDVTSGGTVSAADAELENATFDTLNVTGTVTAQNLSVKNTEIGTLEARSLTITGGDALVKNSTTLYSFANQGEGTATIKGDLRVDSAVEQGGSVVADNVSVNGTANFESVTTGTLSAGAVTLVNGQIATLGTDKLELRNGGRVNVTNDVVISKLTGDGTLDVEKRLTFAETVTTTVNVEAGQVMLLEEGSTLGDVVTNTVIMGEGLLLNDTDVLLTVNSISSLSSGVIGIEVSQSAVDAFAKDAAGRYLEADYLVMEGVGDGIEFMNTSVAQMQTIRRTGMSVQMVAQDGILSLSISSLKDADGNDIEITWDTSEGNKLTNNGYEVSSGNNGFYKSLDYVQNIIVGDECTFDLSTDSVGDSVKGNSSEPLAGLLVRNLSGGGNLIIKGNGASQDIATILSTKGRTVGAEDAVSVKADAVTVNLGLPKGSMGYLPDDVDMEAPVLANLYLQNRSRVNVNGSAEVLGDTELDDFSRLIVAEGNTLSTSTLTGTEEAEIKGNFHVSKSANYAGTYDEVYITTGRGSKLNLRTGARSGLALQASAGSSVTLDSNGEAGSMTQLRVGASPMARLAEESSVLNLLNTKATENGIEHSTLTVTEENGGSYINNTAITLSLGAAETARTLGSAIAPVVIDGNVNVTNCSITVNMLESTVKDGVLQVRSNEDKNLTLAVLVTDGEFTNNTMTLTASPELLKVFSKYYTNIRLDGDGIIRVDRVTDVYSSRLTVSENAQTGIMMADKVLVKENPQAFREDYKDLAGVLDSLDSIAAAGDNAAADELGAAVSGASIAAMGAALAGDVERQLMSIRNRTTTMGVDQSQVNENMPYFNAWINAEGDYRTLDQDETAAGYDLSSWGGTVGFDVDMTPRFTMGLAATAMYGDFTAKSADKADGDLDTYYVTAFARYAAHRWSHTFVATVGMGDASLKRTVTHDNGYYTAEGETNTTTFGFLYEVGYVMAANESATACLQPVFNVMLAHSTLDGYSEENSDAGLTTEGVDMTTVTFGMGARAQAIVGTNLYNRASMLEARALVKVRAGDRGAEAENALNAAPASMGSVKAAEMGAIGAELGLGITVPLGADGSSVFADASLEVGGGFTNINGTVGYRINF